ncbi:MFS transporter [Aliiruegeria lutimaris]|uniref:MFS transporter, DHA1 family, bicyclomycin/chloramphenicol resistance protein n=1 Tax=Aliiruegeria lutimaris TaxID=571298 RepID=A0A1G8J0Q7_9RHOB|nr:MFS transporter [Aliiruegeria lutimaris]SDI24652.1 MFS transporter, DHA1 family, bicyclomycin/chloramphenicol resistance protein [Aliiruegeria lutimaris]
MPQPNSSPFSRTDAVIFMGGITALTAMSVDVVLPATGVVARAFGLEERLGAMLVGVYFLAFAVGQLFWGLFSDAFGRKLALKLTLTGFTLASLACALAPSFQFLIVARFAQGLMGGTPVIARAMVRDVSSGNEAARMMTVLGAILTVATMIAPVVGSGMLVLFSWRAIFGVLALLGLCFLAYTFLVLGQSDSNRRPERFSLHFLRGAVRILFSTRDFLAPMACGSLTFAGYVALGAVGAITVEANFGVGPEAFGPLFAIAALINTVGALLAGQMLKRHSLEFVGIIGFSTLALAGLVNLFMAFSMPGLQLFWGAICLYVLAFGMIYPTAIAAAMEPAADMPGFAASLMGAIQMVAGALGVWVASTLFDGSTSAINLNMALFGIATALLYLLHRIFPQKP